MKSSLYNLLLIVLTLPAFAQQEIRPFGQLTDEEIEMKTYEKDPDAGAVVLFDSGKSIFFDKDGGYDIRFTRHKRVKILNKGELDEAEVEIPYYVDGYGKTERIVSIEAVTYNIDNGIISRQPLSQSEVYEEVKSQRWKVKKFVFPNVQEGSILELQYILETPFHFNLPDWTFQDDIPTIYSQYEVHLVPFWEYVYIAQGINRFDHQKSFVSKVPRYWGSVNEVYGKNEGSGVKFNDYIHQYGLRHIPAFKDESYITSTNDYITKLDFQLAKFHSPRGGTTNIISTWPLLSRELFKDEKFGKYIKDSRKIGKKSISNMFSGENDLEKSKNIINYVKNNFTWNGYQSKYASQNAKSFFENKAGNSADINLFLIGLLIEAGIEAEPLILSTRNHGKIKSDYPFDHFTNYVIPIINVGGLFLTDGTENILAYNIIPPRCINGKGLIVNSEIEQWIDLSPNPNSINRYQIKIDIDKNNKRALVNVSKQSTGYEAFYMRKKYSLNEDNLKEHLSSSNFEIDEIETINYEKTTLPFIVNMKGKAEISYLDNDYVIRPFLHFPFYENPLTEKERDYPVDFIFPRKNEFEIVINTPENYQWDKLPEKHTMDNELCQISIYYQLVDGNLKVSGVYHFKKSTYGPNEYSRIKYYINNIIKHFNPELVLLSIE